MNGIEYYSTDFENEFLADYNFDITQINQESNTFELIICYHILEHVLDDKKAISELYRILKPNGKVYIQTPFKDGDIYEDSSITSPQRRKDHFGQEDHVRIYSINGLKNRLEEQGFYVEVNTFETFSEDQYYGLKTLETVIISTKKSTLKN